MGSIASGTVLNQRYEIIECIGIGGMSEVYRTLDKETGACVALKILKPEYSEEADFIKRFNNEATAAALLDHANIVSIYGIGNDGDIHYIIMEYVEGVTLKDYIEAYQTLAWQDALKISAQILLAMDHAHSQHIIHRDIKPQNVMMGSDGSVKLADFGIARAVTGATITATDDAGSVHYLSPEQARGGYVDERSDIYSLGISLFEMLIGVVPFDGESNVSVALKHIDGKIVPPHEIDVDIPVGVSDLVVIATRKDPGARFQSARDMISKIRKVMEHPDESLIETYIDDPEAVVAAVLSEGSGIGIIKGREALHNAEETEELLQEDNDEDVDSFDSDDSDEDSEPTETKGAKARRIIALVLTYMIAVVCTVFVFMWVWSNYEDSNDSIEDMFEEKPYVMLDFIGHRYEDVEKAMTENGMKVIEPEMVYNDEVVKGSVLEQKILIGNGKYEDLPSGAELFKGTEIRFTVAYSDNYTLTAESILNKSYTDVEKTLTDNKLSVEIEYMMDSKTSKDCVIKIEPPVGSEVKPGSKVKLFVCAGNVAKKITVPDFSGLSRDEAYKKAEEAGIRINLIKIPVREGAEITEIVQLIEQAKENLENPDVSDDSDDTDVPGSTDEPVISETEEPYYTPENGDGSEQYPIPTDPIETETPDDSMTDDTEISEEEPETEDPEDIPDPVTPVYAGKKVVGQYPAAGSVIYDWDSVTIYFYSPDELSYLENVETVSGVAKGTIRERKSIIFEYPADVIKTGTVDYVKIKHNFEGGGSKTVYLPDLIYAEFPLVIDVPFAYGTDVTLVEIYLQGSDGREMLYKKIYVYDN